MHKRSFGQNIILCFIPVMLSLVLCACSDGSRQNIPYEPPVDRDAIMNSDEKDGSTSGGEPDLSAIDTDVQYMITALDKEEKLLAVGRIGLDRTYQYRYDDSTIFLNKYDDYIEPEDLKLGRIVYLGRPNDDAVLTMVKLSGESWYQENITNFSMVAEEGYMLLGQTKYRLSDSLRVFSGGEEVPVSSVSDIDVLSIQGQDRDIYSIRVTKSHGTLLLYNTDLFEGGWLSLGTSVYTTVTKDMSMELPVGKYMLSVANKGYGDTKKVRIKRGEVTKVDLAQYQGEGPELCTLTFEMGIENATLSIDDEVVDTTATKEVEYGIHVVTVNAPGYETWQKKLVVHSGSATITIGDSDLVSDGTNADSDSSSTDEGSEEGNGTDGDSGEETDGAGRDTDSGAEDGSEGNEEGTGSSDGISNASTIEELNSAYLSSLAELLDSLTTVGGGESPED